MDFLTDFSSDDGGLVAKSSWTPVTPQTVAHQAPLFMGFSRQQYWSGLPFPSLMDLPDLICKTQSDTYIVLIPFKISANVNK